MRIAVDADTHVPLRVQVYSTKLANPAFEVGFTSVDFAAPDARQFAFTPPPGTKVSEGDTAAPRDGRQPADASRPEPKVVGTGWSVGRRGPARPPRSRGAGQDTQIQGLLRSIPEVSGTWG